MSTPSITQSVAANISKNVPKGVSVFNTRELENSFFHGMIYAETGAFKTTTAALFGGADRTLIILTRSKEQMIPLREMGFKVVCVEDGSGLLWSLQNPERAAELAGWPEWKDIPDRVLMIDDITEGCNLLVDDNSTRDDGTEVKDGRQVYRAVNDDLRAVLHALKKKRMHLIFIALAKVAQSQIANEETVYPDLPTGARSILTADLEFVFFLRPSVKKLLTQPDYINYVKKDEKTGKPLPGRREIFAKSKLPKEFIGRVPPVLAKEEDLDLGKLWSKISAAKK